jgi:hypothetical protein
MVRQEVKIFLLEKDRIVLSISTSHDAHNKEKRNCIPGYSAVNGGTSRKTTTLSAHTNGLIGLVNYHQ